MEYKSVDDLLNILEKRGLVLGDREVAKHYLSTVGHHRLTAFYEHFYATSKSFDGIPTTIEDVVHLYSFDRRLRLLILGPLEKIEVALRALLIKEMGDYLLRTKSPPVQIELFDPSFYVTGTVQVQRNYSLAKEGCERGAWASWVGPFSKSQIGKGMNRAQKETAFKSFYGTLPAWKNLQSASFGPLTHIYAALKPDIANSISVRFNLSRAVFTTTLFALKELRNSCAHHEPIWNWDARRRSVPLLFPKAFVAPAGIVANPPVGSTQSLATVRPTREPNEHLLYPYCAMIHILLSYLSGGHSTWHRRLKKLVNEYNTMYGASMGFPEDWQAMPFWCVPDVARTTTYSRLRSRVLAPVP
jgi:abortive infection bacteriophage resistance protein